MSLDPKSWPSTSERFKPGTFQSRKQTLAHCSYAILVNSLKHSHCIQKKKNSFENDNQKSYNRLKLIKFVFKPSDLLGNSYDKQKEPGTSF